MYENKPVHAVKTSLCYLTSSTFLSALNFLLLFAYCNALASVPVEMGKSAVIYCDKDIKSVHNFVVQTQIFYLVSYPVCEFCS